MIDWDLGLDGFAYGDKKSKWCSSFNNLPHLWLYCIEEPWKQPVDLSQMWEFLQQGGGWECQTREEAGEGAAGKKEHSGRRGNTMGTWTLLYVGADRVRGTGVVVAWGIILGKDFGSVRKIIRSLYWSVSSYQTEMALSWEFFNQC